MNALQHSLHITFQLGLLRHQPPPPMDFCDHRLVFETTHQRIRLCTVRVVGFEHVQVRGVVVRTALLFDRWLNVQSLSIQVWVVLDAGEDKWVVGHYDLDVVGLLGMSLQVRDQEVNSSRSFIPYEPNRHNVWPVFGWGVVGRCGWDFTEFPGFVVAHGGPIGVTERGRLVANWYGKMELGVGNRSIWNIARSRACTDGRLGFKEVEVETSGGWGAWDADRGATIELVSIDGRVELIDVDGTSGTSGQGISFGG